MSEILTFIDRCLQGTAIPEQIDQYVALWHDGAIGHDLELRELLGMSQAEYALWMRDANAIQSIIAARQKPRLNM
jgi:hypothetical protein